MNKHWHDDDPGLHKAMYVKMMVLPLIVANMRNE